MAGLVSSVVFPAVSGWSSRSDDEVRGCFLGSGQGRKGGNIKEE